MKRLGILILAMAILSSMLAGCGEQQPAETEVVMEACVVVEETVPATEPPAPPMPVLCQGAPLVLETEWVPEVLGSYSVSFREAGPLEREEMIAAVMDVKRMGQSDVTFVLRDDFRWMSPEDLDMLLRIAVAEVGGDDCVICAALVIRTVINRVQTKGFANNIYDVLHTPDQFTPVMEGTYDTAVPTPTCKRALRMVLDGWDESDGVLFYEACTGSSWHSKNLKMAFQHCQTRFYWGYNKK